MNEVFNSAKFDAPCIVSREGNGSRMRNRSANRDSGAWRLGEVELPILRFCALRAWFELMACEHMRDAIPATDMLWWHARWNREVEP